MGDPPNGLTPAAAEALLKIAKELGSGFTGKIVLECNRGGVTKVTKTQCIPIGAKRREDKP